VRMIGKVTLTIDQLIKLYEISNQAEGKSPKTVSWYRDISGLFACYLHDECGQDDISIFTKDTVRNYILYLRERPRFQGHRFTPSHGKVSAKTVQGHVRALKAFSTWLYTEGYTEDNRLQSIKLPKAPAKLIEPLTPDEIQKIMDSIDIHSYTGTRNHALLITLLDTGIREDEITGVTLNNLNLQDGCIKVMGKGAKERIVPIGRYTQMILSDYVRKTRPEPVDNALNALFLSQHGIPITANAIKLMFARLSARSGVHRLHAHLCRHTFAINYLLNGGDIFSLKEILGHTTLEMVNHYLHFTRAQITAQHRKFSPMDKLFSSK